MISYDIDLEILMTVKITQQTAVLQHYFKKNPQTFQNLQYNNFSVPTKREYPPNDIKRNPSSSTATSECSFSQEESIESSEKGTFIQNEQFVHYSNILPASDKKSEAINLLIGNFYNCYSQNSSCEECQIFRSNLYKFLELVALNWKEVKNQISESLAAAVLLIVCMMSNIRQKHVIDSIKESQFNIIPKVS